MKPSPTTSPLAVEYNESYRPPKGWADPDWLYRVRMPGGVTLELYVRRHVDGTPAAFIGASGESGVPIQWFAIVASLRLRQPQCAPLDAAELAEAVGLLITAWELNPAR